MFTASIEDPVTPYIHAVNAVDAVEALNTDIGAVWVWELWAVAPKVIPPHSMKCVFQYMYPRSLLETSTASTVCISLFIAFPNFTQPMLYPLHQYEMCFPIYIP